MFQRLILGIFLIYLAILAATRDAHAARPLAGRFVYAPDAWDVYWDVSLGNPTTVDVDQVTAGTQSFTKTFTTTDNHALLTGASAVLGVDCWRVDGGSGAAGLALVVDAGLQTLGPWEVRARVYQPVLTSGVFVQYAIPFATSRRVWVIQTSGGAAIYSGSATTFWAAGTTVNPGPDLNTGWVTYTLRGYSHPATGAAASANVAVELWIGEVKQNQTVQASSTYLSNGGAGSAGEVKVGRNSGTGLIYVAELAYRRGHNDAPPSWTFQGGGFDR